MAFVCPQCLTSGSLNIALSLHMPPDARSDDIVLQVVECPRCEFCGLAVYEESRRGALDAESWDHTGYWVGEHDLNSVRTAIENCPEPRNTKCQCQSHVDLGRRDSQWRWRGLDGIETRGTFPLRR